MTTQTLNAVFQNGAFLPTSEIHSIIDGQRVRLVVEVEEATDVLDLAGAVFEGLSKEDVDDVEGMALRRGDFFSPSTK